METAQLVLSQFNFFNVVNWELVNVMNWWSYVILIVALQVFFETMYIVNVTTACFWYDASLPPLQTDIKLCGREPDCGTERNSELILKTPDAGAAVG